MGAWNTEHFDNDAAMDWIYDFSLQPDMATLRQCFKQALTANYIDADEGAAVLAAAEVVAAAKGKVGPSWPEDIPIFELPITDELVTTALQAIDKVCGDTSELKELWQESDELEVWLAAVENLKSRLQ